MICLHFRLFKTAFNKHHSHCHTGRKITYNTFSQCYHIPFLEKWLSIFLHDCLECQRNKHFNLKITTAPIQSISKRAQNKSFIRVIVDAFSHFVVTVPTKSNNAKTAIRTFLHPWVVKIWSTHILCH